MKRIVLTVGLIGSFSTLGLAGKALAQEAVAPAAQTNHSRFVGDYALGLMGVGQVAFGLGAGDAPQSVPIIGVRHWLQHDMGVDIGLGLRLAGSSAKVGDTTTDFPEPSVLVLHGGVPFVLADSEYWVLEVIPEMNIGFAGNTVDGDPDTVERGFRFDLGARAGAEMHFGFIDLPQLSLQAGVGVALSYSSFSETIGDANSSFSRWQFATAGGPDPWDFLTSSVTALYYFDQ